MHQDALHSVELIAGTFEHEASCKAENLAKDSDVHVATVRAAVAAVLADADTLAICWKGRPTSQPDDKDFSDRSIDFIVGFREKLLVALRQILKERSGGERVLIQHVQDLAVEMVQDPATIVQKTRSLFSSFLEEYGL